MSLREGEAAPFADDRSWCSNACSHYRDKCASAASMCKYGGVGIRKKLHPEVKDRDVKFDIMAGC